MTERIYIVLLVAIATVLMAGCKADFNPNAEWREVPAVYCLLDQDDTVSYVRVQRCYLGRDDLKGYATVFDSINYAEGEITVQMQVWRDEREMLSGVAMPVRTLDFAYRMMDDKVEGAFCAPYQPVYVHRNNEGDLDTSCVYQLVVSRGDDGSTIATASTRLVGDAVSGRWLTTPAPYGRLGFYHSGTAPIAWLTFKNGRRYQATVRYYYGYRYREVDTLSYVEIQMPAVAGSTASEISGSLASSTLLSTISTALRGDTASKTYYDTAEVYLSIANEDYHAYLNSIAMIRTSLDQELTPYSNIEGGVGVFGARRTRLRQRVLADNSDIGPYGLHFLLEKLDLGFGNTKQ